MKSRHAAVLTLLMGLVVGCGDAESPATTSTTKTQVRTPTLTTSEPATPEEAAERAQANLEEAAATLATACIDAGGGEPENLSELVTNLIDAYNQAEPTEDNNHLLRVAEDNLSNGCGPLEASKVEATLALGELKEVTADTSASDASEPSPAGEPEVQYDIRCDYLLGGGDIDEYRFVAGGELVNVSASAVDLAVQVVYSWDRLGSDPVSVDRLYRVKEGATRDVQITVPASPDDIDAHQAADGECDVAVKIVDAF